MGLLIFFGTACMNHEMTESLRQRIRLCGSFATPSTRPSERVRHLVTCIILAFSKTNLRNGLWGQFCPTQLKPLLIGNLLFTRKKFCHLQHRRLIKACAGVGNDSTSNVGVKIAPRPHLRWSFLGPVSKVKLTYKWYIAPSWFAPATVPIIQEDAPLTPPKYHDTI